MTLSKVGDTPTSNSALYAAGLATWTLVFEADSGTFRTGDLLAHPLYAVGDTPVPDTGWVLAGATSWQDWWFIYHFVTAAENGSSSISSTGNYGTSAGSYRHIAAGGIAVRGGTSLLAFHQGTGSFATGTDKQVGTLGTSPQSVTLATHTAGATPEVGALILHVIEMSGTTTDLTASSVVWTNATELHDEFFQNFVATVDESVSVAYVLMEASAWADEPAVTAEWTWTSAANSGRPGVARAVFSLDDPAAASANQNRFTRRRFSDIALPYDLRSIKLGG